MHKVKITYFAIDSTLISFYTYDTISQDAQNEVPTLVIFYAVELQSFARNVYILHVYFGSEDKGIAYKLSLHHIPFNRDSSQDFEFIIDEDCLLQANYTSDLSLARPNYVNHNISVVQAKTKVVIDLVVK